MLNTVYLALGSNVGQRQKNLEKAVSLLGQHTMIEICDVSRFIETKAVSKVPQPDFLNAVIKIRTILTPFELLEVTQQIELSMGRTSKGTSDPRSIDIDVIFYGNQIVCEEGLTIPHPLMHERHFVLEPLCDIAPKEVHPVLGETIEQLLTLTKGY